MDNAEEKGHNTTPDTRVDKDSIYPNPKTASEPAILSMQTAENDEDPPKTSQQAKWHSIVSFIFTLIPIMIWIYCLAYYCANRKPGIIGTDYTSLVFTYLIIYYYTIGIPLAGTAIGLGIVGLKKGLPKLAKLSLIIKTCYIIIMLLFMSGVIRF